ncbi:hypothetical protein CRV24_007998 [Beauveria bassiana]|nr:hypothetical protein CRV24_007998 [Beauveria bassiana]
MPFLISSSLAILYPASITRGRHLLNESQPPKYKHIIIPLLEANQKRYSQNNITSSPPLPSLPSLCVRTSLVVRASLFFPFRCFAAQGGQRVGKCPPLPRSGFAADQKKGALSVARGVTPYLALFFPFSHSFGSKLANGNPRLQKQKYGTKKTHKHCKNARQLQPHHLPKVQLRHRRRRQDLQQLWRYLPQLRSWKRHSIYRVQRERNTSNEWCHSLARDSSPLEGRE